MTLHCRNSALRSFLNDGDQLTLTFGCAGGLVIRRGAIACERFVIDTLVDYYACIPSGAQVLMFRECVLR